MKNFVKMGHEIEFTASAAVSSGDLVESGAFVGVAIADVANGEQGIAYIEGVFEVPKLGTDDVSQGDILYFDAGNSRLTLTESTNTKAGYAYEDAGTSVSLVKVKLGR
jgi:predicted RecA/RadA family phage recombinase